MSLDARARILLIDDQPLVRIGLTRLLAAEPWLTVCAEAGASAEAVRLARAHDPDLAVMELMLRDGGGLELIRALLAALPHLGILVLSMHDQRVYAERCLAAGARGYLMKEEAAESVVAALRVVAAGGTFLSPALGRSGDARPPLMRLSDRELRVFELIGESLPTRVIAERLGLSDKTVEAHKANIKAKLGISHAAELARFATAWRESGR